MNIDPIALALEVVLDEENSRPWDNEFSYKIKNGELRCSVTSEGRGNSRNFKVSIAAANSSFVKKRLKNYLSSFKNYSSTEQK